MATELEVSGAGRSRWARRHGVTRLFGGAGDARRRAIRRSATRSGRAWARSRRIGRRRRWSRSAQALRAAWGRCPDVGDGRLCVGDLERGWRGDDHDSPRGRQGGGQWGVGAAEQPAREQSEATAGEKRDDHRDDDDPLEAGRPCVPTTPPPRHRPRPQPRSLVPADRAEAVLRLGGSAAEPARLPASMGRCGRP